MDAFIRVVDAGSFSGAAKQLRTGQPAVSKAIVHLEERLTVRLLLRTTRRLTPTEAGWNFYEHAKRSIEEADAAELAARGSATTLSGRVRVQATAAFARLHVIPHLPRFLAQHPALDVDLVIDDRNIDLVERGIDIGLRAGQLRNSTLTARKIAECQRRVIGTPSYFKTAGVPRIPADLVTHQVIIYEQPLGGPTWTFRQGEVEASVTLRGRVRLTTTVGVRECVLADLGLAIASEWMFAPELKDKTVKTVLADWSLPPVEAWAIYPAGRQASAKARAFASFIESEMSISRITPSDQEENSSCAEQAGERGRGRDRRGRRLVRAEHDGLGRAE
jgi:DNA-binding transcriptional LysR family regulator